MSWTTEYSWVYGLQSLWAIGWDAPIHHSKKGIEKRYRISCNRMECFMFCRILSSSWESVSIEVNAPPISTTQWKQKLPFDWLKIFVRLLRTRMCFWLWLNYWWFKAFTSSILWKYMFVSDVMCIFWWIFDRTFALINKR